MCFLHRKLALTAGTAQHSMSGNMAAQQTLNAGPRTATQPSTALQTQNMSSRHGAACSMQDSMQPSTAQHDSNNTQHSTNRISPHRTACSTACSIAQHSMQHSTAQQSLNSQGTSTHAPARPAYTYTSNHDLVTCTSGENMSFPWGWCLQLCQ